MFIRLINYTAVILPAGLFITTAAFCAPIDDWNSIILDGSHHKFEGQYKEAIQSFTKAVSFAEKQKLPNKCLPISLCRLAEVQVISDNVKEGDSHFEQITSLFKMQKDSNTLDPQFSFWVAALADAYQSSHKPDTLELCLKHACYLKNMDYGSTHRECTECLSKLADFYINQGQTEKAIKILTFTQALADKKSGKNPDALGDKLNSLAIKCKNEHKYGQAEQLELAVVKLAKSNSGTLNAGLPAFYSFLGMNALAHGKSVESKDYFQKARKECFKIKGQKKKEILRNYLSYLPNSVWADRLQNKFILAELEYKQLIALHKAIASDPHQEYDLYTRLADVLFEETNQGQLIDKLPAVIKCMEETIAIAEAPNSKEMNTLPDLYMRLAIYQLYTHNLLQADKTFSRALKMEKDKNGFHAAIIFFWWGYNLKKIGQNHLAAEKLNSAYRLVTALPPKDRGTLLADLLHMLSLEAHEHGRQSEVQELEQKSLTEIRLQKSLKSFLGPDLYKRMQTMPVH